MYSVDPLGDNKSRIELIDCMGGDLAIVNDARVSYAKESKQLSEKDSKLINYLIENEHNSPLRSTIFKFRVKMPLFLARQHYKHIIASSFVDDQRSWNEQSFRYVAVPDANEFYIPDRLRSQSKINRQASSDSKKIKNHDLFIERANSLFGACYRLYKDMLNQGVAREQARMVLPSSVYTTFIWTVSLQAMLHYLDLRSGSGAQYEISLYAKKFKEVVKEVCPIALEAWESKRNKQKEKKVEVKTRNKFQDLKHKVKFNCLVLRDRYFEIMESIIKN